MSSQLCSLIEKYSSRALENDWVGGWLPGAMTPRELVYLLARCEDAHLSAIIESGRQNGVSTGILASNLISTGVKIGSIDWELDPKQAQACRDRLAMYPNIFLVKGDAAEEIPKLIDRFASSRIGLVVDGPKNFEALSLMFAAAQHPEICLMALHNLTRTTPARKELLMYAKGPCFFEDENIVVDEWSLLGELEARRLGRLAAHTYRSDRSSLGILELDEDIFRENFLRLRYSFGIMQPRIVDFFWRRRKYSSVKSLLALSYSVKSPVARIRRYTRAITIRVADIAVATRELHWKSFTFAYRMGYKLSFFAKAARRAELTSHLKGLNKQISAIESYRETMCRVGTFPRPRPVDGAAPRWIEYKQLEFASNVLATLRYTVLHDIGSDRRWVVGLGSYYTVHTIGRDAPEQCFKREVFAIGEPYSLPWPDNSVDCILAIGVLDRLNIFALGQEFVENVDAACVGEAFRVLKRHGSIILTAKVAPQAQVCYGVDRWLEVASLPTLFSKFTLLEQKYYSPSSLRWLNEIDARSSDAGYSIVMLHGKKLGQ